MSEARNLTSKAPHAQARFDDALLSQLEILAREASLPLLAWARELGLPLRDAPVLTAAVEAGADLLVTGDTTHFGRLLGHRRRAVEIVTPRDTLARQLAG